MSLNPYEQKEIIYAPEQEAAANPVGYAMQKCIVRQIAENGYPVIAPSTFKQYAKDRIQAAQVLYGEGVNQTALQKLSDIIETFFDDKYQASFQAAKDRLISTYQQTESALIANEIDYAAYLHSNAQVQKAYLMAFNKLYRHQLRKLKQINLLLTHLLDPLANPKKVMQDLNCKVQELRCLQARPVQEHHYKVEALDIISWHIPQGWLTYEQQKLFEECNGTKLENTQPYSLPSMIHDHRQIGQINALGTKIQIAGNVAFKGHRHGSACPYQISDEIQRQYRTLENVKQTVALAAKEQFLRLKEELTLLQSKSTDKQTPIDKARKQYITKIFQQEIPLPINMNSLSLLGPTRKRKNPLHHLYQLRQLEDTRFAYWSLHGRKITLPDFVNDEGKAFSLAIELNSTFINQGLNSFAKSGPAKVKKLVQRINNRGINQFIDNFLAQSYLTADPQINEVIASLREIESQSTIEYYKQKIKDFDKTKLHAAYQELEIIHYKIVRTQASTQELTHLKRTRKKILSIIKRQESKLDHLFKKLTHARTSVYKNKIKLLNKKLDNIQEKLKSQNKLTIHHHFQQLQLFIDALAIYYTPAQSALSCYLKSCYLARIKHTLIKKLVTKAEANPREALIRKIHEYQTSIDLLKQKSFDFQTRFALLAYKKHHFIEWFCQNGQDRTSLLNEHIETYCIFMEKYGYPARWDNVADTLKFYAILPYVHNGAPNRETKALNNDSPGLKIIDENFYAPSVNYVTDELMAKLAIKAQRFGKRAAKLLQKIQPLWEEIMGNTSQETTEILLTNLANPSATPAPELATSSTVSDISLLEFNQSIKELAQENATQA